MTTEVLVAIIGGTATVTATVVTGIFKILEIQKNKIKKNNEAKPLTQFDLFEKDLFSKSDYWIAYTIKRLGFEHGDKSWIYETILKNKIQTISDRTKVFLEKNTLNDMQIGKFENAIFALISEIVDEYNLNIKKDFQEYFGESKGEKIYDLIMDKQPTKESPSIGFNGWHATTITCIEKSISNHCEVFYPNNIERMSMILDEFKTAIFAAHAHLFKTFRNFNGELDYLLCL